MKIENRKKGNKTLEQANMKLMNQPKHPTKNQKYLSVNRTLHTIKSDIPKEWTDYIF